MTRAGREQVFAVLFAVVMVTSMIAGTAAISGGAAAAPGDVVHRVNAGDSPVAATDGGPEWAASDGTYVSGGDTYADTVSVSTDASVPASTPTSMFQSELYGDQQWTFSENVQSGQTYEVRLYFAEIFHGVDAGNPGGGTGDRVFDVAVEDETVLDGYDIYADVGPATGVMKSFAVTPADGQIDIDLSTVEDNAKISAIEIVESAPEPNTLEGPSQVDFGDVLVDDSETESVTLTNLGGDGDANITIDSVSASGDGAFSAGTASKTTLSPGESADVPVTFAPTAAQESSATLDIEHSGSNSPLSVDLSGEGASAADPSFQKSTLEGFSAGNPTAIDFGPGGRAYVSTQGGTVYALDVTRTGENSYEVVNEVQIDAIKDIPNHDDFGNHDVNRTKRQITGITAGGTAAEPVIYVSSSDAQIDVGDDDDTKDTNSGAISRLTISPGSDGTLQQSEVDHEVLVLGLPRSEENHSPNGMDLSADEETLYLAVGGHTNKGAPSNNFGHTPEYALSAAILEIDLAQIADEHQPKNLNDYDDDYPTLDFYYGIPTIQNDDSTDGDDLPFGGNDGINQAKLIEGGPVQIYSAGYRNPYDLVVAESGQVYAADHGPNGGWGGQPADANGDTTADAAAVTNHPNEDGSYTTSDQLVKVDEGDYGGHPAPVRANPTGADIYDSNGEMVFDINASNSPVPASMVDPQEADYVPPTSGSPDPGAPAGSANTMEFEDGDKVLFGPTGGTAQYTASNFGGAMDGDLLQVELGGDVERVELTEDGSTVKSVETIANTAGPLGITAQGDDDEFAGTIWTADIGGNGVTVLEPVDYGTEAGDGGGGATCTGADDPALDEDGDGYDNADEIDAGTDPCSSASTPADFDGDGTSNLNDPDDDNDGLNDTEDPFAVDPNNGLDTTLPVQHDLSELSLFGENGQGWTGVMTNGTDYQALYDPTQMTVGGAAEVLTVEDVPQGDAYADTNTQQYAFQFGVDPPTEPFTVESTVASFPANPENYQSAGIYVGTGDQSDYAKLAVVADGGNGGVEFAQEEGDSFTHQTSPDVVSDANVTGADTTLRLTVDPTTDPLPDNGEDEVALTAEYEVDGETTDVGTAAIPASWLDTSDGTGLAVGVISTSNGAGSTFDATWTDIGVDYVTPPENEPPVADAGADQTVDEGQEVTLDGSGSDDPNGDQLGYTWTQTAGPDAGLSQSDGETATFTAPKVDTESMIGFQLSVSDGQDSDTDEVNVTVQPVADEPPADDTMTVAEAVATGGEDDSLIEDAEIQQAINWWATDSEVPDTGGETIGDSEIQQLINYWATVTPVGDANGPPTASFTVSPDAPEAGQQVSFDASGSSDDGSIASYEWDFDG
ncbi:malectin domain-containing carbohydrate-binding protein, partial [Halorubrum sp. T3]|uniref:PKD domain-containing protein n=1 Tax=Halorubrum sp. T3 TaxID=1194088 RepID=UPI00037AA68C